MEAQAPEPSPRHYIAIVIKNITHNIYFPALPIMCTDTCESLELHFVAETSI